MGDEINAENGFRKRRPIPVPLYDRYIDDRYIERPYLKKHELAKIRDNLDELVEIKESEMETKGNNVTEFKSIVDDNKVIDNKPDRDVDNKVVEDKVSDANIPNTTNIFPAKDENSVKISEPMNKVKTEEPKIGITNLEYNKEIKKFDINNKKNDTKSSDNKQKINKRKVKRMNDEDVYTGVSPEDRRRLRKAELQELKDEDDSRKAMLKAAHLAEENKIELENLKRRIAEENAKVKDELKSEFGNKFNEFGNKFNEVGGKVDKVTGKLEETCTGIECLKKDLANINKNMDLVECDSCHVKAVPPLASYCPNCSAKINTWFEDDGVTPIKGWKPSWEK